MITLIEEETLKSEIARTILESLSDWFGIPESREDYIEDSKKQLFFAAYHKELPIGFITLKPTSKHTAELSVIGVLQDYHRKGVGRELFAQIAAHAKNLNYSFIQVKTVASGHYDIYDNTNKFYKNLGFKEFEVFPTLWDEKNPCQIYVMAL